MDCLNSSLARYTLNHEMIGSNSQYPDGYTLWHALIGVWHCFFISQQREGFVRHSYTISQPGLRIMAEVTISRLEKFDIGKEYGSFEFGDISRQIGT